MKTVKKILSMILALVLVLGLLPATAFATGAADVVYLSISFDSNYIDDKNGDPIAYVPIPMSSIEAIDTGLQSKEKGCPSGQPAFLFG